MKKGDRKGSLNSLGFTIIETMIVLAVTSLLFLIIASTLGGRQNESEFIHGVQDAQAQVQQVINQVADGIYPSENNFSCTNHGSGRPAITEGSNSQGTNQDCILLGSVIQFGVQNTNPETYNVYTVAGLNLGNSAGGSVTSSPFYPVVPTVVAISGSPYDYATTPLEYGLTACWIGTAPINSCTNSGGIGAIGFLMEPGSLSSTSANGYSSGVQPVDLVPISETSLDQSTTAAIRVIDGSLDSPNLTFNPPAGIEICLASGSTHQSGLITIGGSGGQLLVKLSIMSNETCSS